MSAPSLEACGSSNWDVVVVGGGGAGLAAAISAAESGAKVLLLELSAALGGTTRYAVGSITAAGTRLQARRGVRDDVSAFYQDMDAFTADLLPEDNPVLRGLLAREAAPTVDWLEDLGVVFVGPFEEPPHRVPRMHNVVPGPPVVIRRLERHARRLGVTVQFNARPVALLQEAGRVTGIEYVVGKSAASTFASGAVVLSTGDFSGNTEWRKRWLPEAAASATPVNPGNTGGGHQLARALGAHERNMGRIFGPQLRFPRAPGQSWIETLPDWPWLLKLGAAYLTHAPGWALRRLVKPLLIANMSPAPELFQAGVRLLDSKGRRLAVERPAEAVAYTSDNKAYLVFDASLAKRFSQAPYAVSTAPGIAYAFVDDYLRGRPDIAAKLSGRAALARHMGLDPTELEDALAGWGDGPWVVLGPVHAMITTTEGSLAVDESLRVLDESGAPIPGLFAAGCVGQGGLLLRGHGLHWAWTFTSGRLAGKVAAGHTTGSLSA